MNVCLPARPGRQRKRLRDAMQRLNGVQVASRLHFHANGSGNGVLWEVLCRSNRPRR